MPSEDTKILEFIRYQKLIKRHLLVQQILIESLIEKKLMDVKIILKKHL